MGTNKPNLPTEISEVLNEISEGIWKEILETYNRQMYHHLQHHSLLNFIPNQKVRVEMNSNLEVKEITFHFRERLEEITRYPGTFVPVDDGREFKAADLMVGDTIKDNTGKWNKICRIEKIY